jgi:chromate transporter
MAAGAGMRVSHTANTNAREEFHRFFLKCGLSCFGSLIAHIRYFRRDFIERRRWLATMAYIPI